MDFSGVLQLGLSKFEDILDWLQSDEGREYVGNVLYRTGFYVEYSVIQIFRFVLRIARFFSRSTVGLFKLFISPILDALKNIYQFLSAPFKTFYKDTRQLLKELDNTEKLSGKELLEKNKRVIKPVVISTLKVILRMAIPVSAALVLVVVVHQTLQNNIQLSIKMNGQYVGNAANEQVYLAATHDVQERLNNAKNVLISQGLEPGADTTWTIDPTYTLVFSSEPPLTESELADSIMSLTSDDICEATAIYVDDSLQFVTSEGDHLRAFLENYRMPQDAKYEPNTYVEYVHDIHLEDGLYIDSSIVPQSNIISWLKSGANTDTYTAGPNETVQSVLDMYEISMESLTSMNPELTSPEQSIPEGTIVTVGMSSPELLKLKTVKRVTYEEPIAFSTEKVESNEYEYGETLQQQEGENGLQRVIADTTYIDNVEISSEIRDVQVIKEPVPRITIVGTHIESGEVVNVGTGSFIWPVPTYKYVSRWMGSGHRGADICAEKGSPIVASDSGVVTVAADANTGGSTWSYGTYVVIDHGNGWTTLYAHMLSRAVNRGDTVTQGQIIGYVGTSGNSSGYHCHFEMMQRGVLYNAKNIFGSKYS